MLSRAWIAVLCAAAAATIIVATGCSESRAARAADAAQSLAREGRYDEAIGMLRDVHARYPDTRAARGTRDLLVVWEGLRDAELKADRRRAKEDLTALGRALFRFHDRARRYPDSLGELPEGASLQLVDPWGWDYLYRVSKDRRHYRLECYGRDGLPGGSGDDRDLRIVNGTFRTDLPWAER